MRLWELRPIDKDSGPWEPWYDKAFGFVVRADTEAQARLLASAQAGDEKAAAWLDASLSRCEELTDDGEASVVMQDFASA